MPIKFKIQLMPYADFVEPHEIAEMVVSTKSLEDSHNGNYSLSLRQGFDEKEIASVEVTGHKKGPLSLLKAVLNASEEI